MQQSASDAYISPQLSVPHLRWPMHSPLLSQSPSPNSQGDTAVQQSHVADVQSQTIDDASKIQLSYTKVYKNFKKKYINQVLTY